MYEYFELDKKLVKCHPSARQLAVEEMEFYAFAHFTVNTFTDKEWGDGTEPESIFNPTELDADQWVDALKSAGIKGLILACKHTTASACGPLPIRSTRSRTALIRTVRATLSVRLPMPAHAAASSSAFICLHGTETVRSTVRANRMTTISAIS